MKLIKSEVKETVHTLELTQKEVQALVEVLGQATGNYNLFIALKAVAVGGAK